MISSEFTKDGYLVENGKYCEGNMNERMLNETNVIDARLWCTKDPSCVEIYSVCGQKTLSLTAKRMTKYFLRVVDQKCTQKVFMNYHNM